MFRPIACIYSQYLAIQLFSCLAVQLQICYNKVEFEFESHATTYGVLSVCVVRKCGSSRERVGEEVPGRKVIKIMMAKHGLDVLL